MSEQVSNRVLSGDCFRLTVITERLFRLEHGDPAAFVDGPTQTVVCRDFAPKATFTVEEDERWLRLETPYVSLRWDRHAFSPEGLTARVKAGGRARHEWRYGARSSNLGGTLRTLDEATGPMPLEPGILSADGVATLDDSRSLLLVDDGAWLEPRRSGAHDLYLFAYGHDYRGALHDFFQLTGEPPLLPRYALGNWWSRYHAYTADEYLALMDRFREQRVPLSVAVIDMDWHLTDIDPRYGSGWTGFSWNRQLFGDPPAFLRALHERGLHTTLNLHPAEGVAAHEDAYPALARRLGVNPASEEPVPFDASDRRFMEAYVEELHHPLEAAGVDFFWMDWQQGVHSSVPNLDPLWLLNHLHFRDASREGRRGLLLSRYAGPGSHRYPVGFSGDAFITWEMLDFEPYLTATASNIGYGWWSHDLGGHDLGRYDEELLTRWVEFGVFSPIFRLHSSSDPFLTREPWAFGLETQNALEGSMRLRHRLVPYLYTMNERAHRGEPLVQPLYYEYPARREAYVAPNEYFFGSELLVAPITAPADPDAALGMVDTWLPPGTWTDVFTGLVYDGDRRLRLCRPLQSIPVLARAGAILPLVAEDAVAFGTANPQALEVRVYAGASGSLTLLEDRDDERWARTPLAYDEERGEVRIGPVSGEREAVPLGRRLDLVLCSFRSVDEVVRVAAGGEEVLDLERGREVGATDVRVHLGEWSGDEEVVLRVEGDRAVSRNPDADRRLFDILSRAHIGYREKQPLYAAATRSDRAAALADLIAQNPTAGLLAALAEVVLAAP